MKSNGTQRQQYTAAFKDSNDSNTRRHPEAAKHGGISEVLDYLKPSFTYENSKGVYLVFSWQAWQYESLLFNKRIKNGALQKDKALASNLRSLRANARHS